MTLASSFGLAAGLEEEDTVEVDWHRNKAVGRTRGFRVMLWRLLFVRGLKEGAEDFKTDISCNIYGFRLGSTTRKKVRR